MNQNKVNIYVVCHKDAYIPDLKCLKPIQVGADLADDKLDGMLYDNTGENISNKNKSYCELTAQYWAWKNEDADYYGFFHYRRYFSFNTYQNFEEDGWGNIVLDRLTDDDLQKYHIDDEHIQKLVSNYDVITVKARDINENRKLSGGAELKNNYTEYGVSDAQHIADLDTAIKIIVDKYPEFQKAVESYMHDDKAYECNMFIMSKTLYSEYCIWLFDILSELEKNINLKNYNQEELRVMGFIAERLFGIYYTYLKENPSIKSLELQKVLIKKTDAPVMIKRLDTQYVPVVLSANNGFVPYLSTMLESILRHANPSRGYDIIILHRDISAENQQRMKIQAALYPHCSVRFANVQQYFDSLKLFVNQHLSIETYYRLVVQELMPDYDKVLYLDSDMVAECDVADLYDIVVGENLIGAAKDIDIAGQVKTNPEMRDYVLNQIGLKDPFEYFQAGVLILNLKELRKLITADELLKIASENEWKCHDQDVLNYVCKGRVYYIPQKWNVMMIWKEQGRSREDFLKKAPAGLYFEWQNARKKPLMVHFAGYQKPWNVLNCDMAPYFWNYARNTPFYEEMIVRIINKEYSGFKSINQPIRNKSIIQGGIQCVKDHGVLYTFRLAIKKIVRRLKR